MVIARGVDDRRPLAPSLLVLSHPGPYSPDNGRSGLLSGFGIGGMPVKRCGGRRDIASQVTIALPTAMTPSATTAAINHSTHMAPLFIPYLVIARDVDEVVRP